MKHEEWNADEVVSHVDVRFGWVDRLRILLGRTAWIKVSVKTENVVGRTESESSAHVLPIFPRRNRPGVAVSNEVKI